MGAYAYLEKYDDPNHPGLNASSLVRPLYRVLYSWGSKGMLDKGSDANIEFVRVERMRQAHEALPYTLPGFKAWLEKNKIDLGQYSLEYISQWDQYDFDEVRDFVRHCALNNYSPTFSM